MKILVKIKGNTLSILNKKKLNTEHKNMLNTNVISNDELVFSDTYIKENPQIVASFLSELVKSYHINTIIFQNIEVSQLIMPFLNKIKGIKNLRFDSNEVLPYKICEKVIKCPEIKTINAQYIPQYMFELLDKNEIIPESRNEILFTSNFMSSNHLTTYSSLFYKTTINLEFPLSIDDTDDFIAFCKINKRLKNIHINIPNKFNLEEIINILKEYQIKNVRIYIHGDVHEKELIEYLKKNNKFFKKRYKITLKLKYSDKYISENIAKQTNINILRMCGLMILAIAVFSFSFVFYDNYQAMLRVSEIKEELKEHIESANPEEIITEIENENDLIVKNNYIASLKMINQDAVGWVKVNNTNIDYPILQTTDNNHYLNHNIYNKKDSVGWIFMDYENDTTNIDDNIILYGHNNYVNGVMFGTLNKVLYRNWYTKPENQIIKFDTLYGSFEYQIFSFYIIPTTSDYLTVNYDNPEKKMEFLNTISKRSNYNFGVELNENSKILTLSTCQDEKSRLVVHSVLVNHS